MSWLQHLKNIRQPTGAQYEWLHERLLHLVEIFVYPFLLHYTTKFVNSAFIDLIASSDSGSSSSEEGSECWQMQHAIAQSLKEEK